MSLKTYTATVREVVNFYVTVEAVDESSAKKQAEDLVCNSDEPISDFDSQLVSRTVEVSCES